MARFLRHPRVAAEPLHRRAGTQGVGGVGPVGPLEEMRRAEADPAHRRRVSGDVGARQLRHQVNSALAPPRVRADAEGLGVMGHPAGDIGIAEIAVDGRRHRLDLRGAAPQVLGYPAREVVGQRLHREVAARAVQELHRSALAPGDAVERTDRPAALRTPRELRGTEDRGVLGHVGKLDRDRETTAERRDLRRPPDAPRRQHRQARHVGAEEAAEPTQAEVPRTLDEERPLFVEESLKGGKIHDCRVDFDLTEIGVDGRIERQVGRDAQRGVAADATIDRVRIEEWIGPIAGNIRRASHRVRHQLRAAGRMSNHQTMQVSEARRPARLVQSPPRPLRQLVQPVLLTPDLQAPGLLLGRLGIPQL